MASLRAASRFQGFLRAMNFPPRQIVGLAGRAHACILARPSTNERQPNNRPNPSASEPALVRAAVVRFAARTYLCWKPAGTERLPRSDHRPTRPGGLAGEVAQRPGGKAALRGSDLDGRALLQRGNSLVPRRMGAGTARAATVERIFQRSSALSALGA